VHDSCAALRSPTSTIESTDDEGKHSSHDDDEDKEEKEEEDDNEIDVDEEEDDDYDASNDHFPPPPPPLPGAWCYSSCVHVLGHVAPAVSMHVHVSLYGCAAR
jgi:hypothetical protein